MSETKLHEAPPGAQLLLQLKPPPPQYREWMFTELQNYHEMVKYLAFFCEARSKMGDMESDEVFDELKNNVCLQMRGGYDVLGTQ